MRSLVALALGSCTAPVPDVREVAHEIRLRGQRQRTRLHDLVEAGARRQGIDEMPIQGALAPYALGCGAEKIRMIPAHPALIYQPGEAAGAGQHREQRQLRQ